MKNLLAIVVVMLALNDAFAQPLSFATLGYEPAYCRLFPYQNGKGQLYVSATGGTPTYTYEWENLGTGATSSATTWGNINAGDYQITVTDAAANVLIDTVTVDSLNPISNFDVISADLDSVPGGWVGIFHAEVVFVNLSQNFANPIDPFADTTFWWNYNVPWGGWNLTNNLDPPDPVVNFWGGNHLVALLTQNSNGCTDTLFKTIGIFGPVGEEELVIGDKFNVISQSSTGTIVCLNSFEGTVDLAIYSIEGALLHEKKIEPGVIDFPLESATGTYVYTAYETNTGKLVSKGKFIH